MSDREVMGMRTAAAESALRASQRLGTEAAKTGFDWPTAADALEKVREETEEVAEALGQTRERQAEELGDLLFAACMVARLLGIDAEQALDAANQKFAARYQRMIEALERAGEDPQLASLERMEQVWQQIK